MFFSQLSVKSGFQVLVLEQCHAVNQYICVYHINMLCVCVSVHASLYVCVCIDLCIHVCVHICMHTHLCVFCQIPLLFYNMKQNEDIPPVEFMSHALTCMPDECVTAFKYKLTPLFVDSTILQCFWRVFHWIWLYYNGYQPLPFCRVCGLIPVQNCLLMVLWHM